MLLHMVLLLDAKMSPKHFSMMFVIYLMEGWKTLQEEELQSLYQRRERVKVKETKSETLAKLIVIRLLSPCSLWKLLHDGV